MKQAPDWILVGMVKRIHEKEGEMLIRSLTENEDRFAPGTELSLTRKRSDVHEPVRIVASRPSDKGPIVRLDGIDNNEDAWELFGASLFIPASELTEPAPHSYYAFQLEGCEVFQGGRRIGAVSHLQESRKANPYLEVDPGGEEKLINIPFVKAVIKEIDLERQRIEIVEGFLE